MATSTINHNAYGSSHHYGPSASHSRSTANNYHSPSYQSATASVISPTETEFSEAYDAPEAISDWDEKKVGEWLRSINYAQYESLFRKNDIRGETLVEMDQSLLKEIGIKKIGDRVRVFSSIKSLRTRSSGLTRRRNRESLSMLENLVAGPYTPSNPSSARTTPGLQSRLPPLMPRRRTDGPGSSALGIDGSTHRSRPNSPADLELLRRGGRTPHSQILSPTAEARQNGQSYFGANQIVVGANLRKPASPIESNRQAKLIPSLAIPISSLAGGQVSKMHYIKIIYSTYTKGIDVQGCTTGDEITRKILRKFPHQDFKESQSRAFGFYLLNGREPDPRMVVKIDQEELLRICTDVHRSERCFIMRRPHTGPPAADELLAAANAARGAATGEHSANLPKNTRSKLKLQDRLGESWETIQEPLSPAYAPENPGNMTLQPPPRSGKVKALAGERPPSELITGNLAEYFPDHDKEHLDNTIRMSVRRSMRLSRALSTRFSVASTSSFSSSLKDAPPMPAIADTWLKDGGHTAKPVTRPLSVIRPGNWRDSVASSLEPLPEEPNISDRHSFISLDSNSEPSSANVPSASTIHSTSYFDDGSITSPSGNSDFKEISQLLAADGEGPDEGLDQFLAGDPWENGNWIKGTLIGQGSFGSVYLALHGITGELMAVKQVEMPETSAGPVDAKKKSMIEALRREISLLNDLKHPNIVQYLGSGSTDQYLNIFLEYVPGGSVAAMLAQYGCFKEAMIKNFVRQILSGLAYLHNKDIIHRDIKGANVLVDNKGGIKISDFGISKRVEASSLLKPDHNVKTAHRVSLQGSVFWMAPEVVKQTSYTKKADIWSLGCLIVEMFTGQHPFPDLNQLQAMFKIGEAKRPGRPEGCSDAAAAFLDQTFEVNWEKRPSAEVLLESEFLATAG